MTETTDKYEVVSPRLRKLLVVVFVLFAVLVVDSIYLGSVTFVQWLTGENYEDYVYQSAFLIHLSLGLLIIVPAVAYGLLHLRRAIDYPNRLAVRLGLTLFGVVIVLLVSGLVLTRGIPLIELQHPIAREWVYWAHVITPLIAVWLFILHRLAGRPIRWIAGGGVVLVSIVLVGVLTFFAQPPDKDQVGGDFFPSLARTNTGDWIPSGELMRDEYCAGCHSDIHGQWAYSAHRFASFNNPAYLFTVRNTREALLERDGDVRGARFCAGCHDPVPLFSGAFDDPNFDDVHHITAQAGITCIACHGIESLGSNRGNSDYVIAAPEHYPFAFSESQFLAWVNGVLIKGKPSFHKRTFLKPVHKTPEFCGTCHKVHLPEELNDYRWLRGQNHYDSFLLSGVSGHGVQSFYYPSVAEGGCNGCHMPLKKSQDFGAQPFDSSGELKVHGHHFPGANTAIPYLLDFPESVNEAHRKLLENSLRVDIFAVRAGNDITGAVLGPVEPTIPALKVGQEYVVDVVLRNLTTGHLFTEGTADSNEVWVEVEVKSGKKLIGHSGGQSPDDGTVDPWSHFVNAYVVDRNGDRIDQRNAEDIFTKLYDHQIPPGAADTVHYKFRVPEGVESEIEVRASLRFRKFDTKYTRAFQGDEFKGNDLPITTIATDRVTFPIDTPVIVDTPNIDEWERWNDYGIGLLRKPENGALRQAETAFKQVIALGRPEGYLNLARVLIREGRLEEAIDALKSAAEGNAYPWSVDWFGGLVDMQRGEFDSALEAFETLVATNYVEARGRGFDFSRDYRLQNTLADTLFNRSKLARTEDDRLVWLRRSKDHYLQALKEDPENVTSHYGLMQVLANLGDEAGLAHHRMQHERYRPDDNARDRALTAARARDPAANHASEAIVIYDLQRHLADGYKSVYPESSENL